MYDPAVNVDRSVELGTNQWHVYEDSWPGGFHNSLKKFVKTMAVSTKKQVRLGGKLRTVKPDFIFAQAMGIMASSRETIPLEKLLDYELCAIPASTFDDDGYMRKTTKSVLKTKLEVVCGARSLQAHKVIIIDGCALLWMISWPALPATVSKYVTSVVTDIKS